MKEELFKMAQECLSEEEVKEILRNKFKESIESAIEKTFRWGKVESALKKKIEEVMVPYIEKYDFSEYLPKLDTVLTEIVNSDACIENKKILENFKDLSIKQEEKEIKVTDLFEAWIKMCEKKISTTGLEVEFDDGPYYESVGCEMRIEESERPVWSSVHRAVIVFENDHDEELNIEIPISKWDFESKKQETSVKDIFGNIANYMEFHEGWVRTSCRLNRAMSNPNRILMRRYLQ